MLSHVPWLAGVEVSDAERKLALHSTYEVTHYPLISELIPVVNCDCVCLCANRCTRLVKSSTPLMTYWRGTPA